MSDGRGRIWETIALRARTEGVQVAVRHACLACVDAVGGAGGAVSLGIDGAREPVFATDQRSGELEELQNTLNEGPGHDATDGPILVPDLLAHTALHRWAMFGQAAVERGIHAVFAFPISTGAARVGVMEVYRETPGQLTSTELADALASADAALILTLDGREDVPPNLGNSQMAERRAEVHQAVGMISVQLAVNIIDALARLRAYAYLHDLQISAVAHDVVERRLRFDRDDNQAHDA